MPRDVTDPPTGGTTWTRAQTFAGLGEGSPGDAKRVSEAARVPGSEDRFRVVCTPGGGARSVRLELPGNWEAEMPDEDPLAAIRAGLGERE